MDMLRNYLVLMTKTSLKQTLNFKDLHCFTDPSRTEQFFRYGPRDAPDHKLLQQKQLVPGTLTFAKSELLQEVAISRQNSKLTADGKFRLIDINFKRRLLC